MTILRVWLKIPTYGLCAYSEKSAVRLSDKRYWDKQSWELAVS